LGTLALSLILMLALVPAAHAGSPVPLSLNLTGTIENAGSQQYSQSGGGFSCAICGAEIDGYYLDPTTASFTESVSASTSGLATTGTATFSLSGGFLGVPGTTFSLGGTIPISSDLPAEPFPVGCTTTCTSEVPAFFLGTGSLDLTVTTGGSPVESSLTPAMALESAFLNPFGGPIVWASDDGSIVLVFTYAAATIDWTGVQVAGSFTGTLGTTPLPTPVSGLVSQTTSAHEDLFAGTEIESGTIEFTDASPVGLDGIGTYSGSSTIPTAGSVDCSLETTGIPGTCTETGFSSSGTISLDGVAISLGYSLAWFVPALGFTGTATGTATPSSGGIPGVPQFGAAGLLPLLLALPLLLLLRSRKALLQR